MKLTANFKSSEFDCRDGTKFPDEWLKTRLLPLCQALEKIRSKIGDKPIKINSGYRTQTHNKKIGGSKYSQHMQGLAVDFSVKGMNARNLYKIVLKMLQTGEIPQGGLGSYKNWVHYDIRGKGARWRV